MAFDDTDRLAMLLIFGPPVAFLLWLSNRILFPDKHSYPGIPAVGPTSPLLYYIGAIRLLFNGNEMVQEGYTRYKGGPFKVPELFNWHVVVSGPKMIEELRKAGDDELNFDEASAELDHTIGPAIHHDTYHIAVIRARLTRSIGAIFEDVRDELVESSNDALPLSDGRNPEYIALNVNFASSVMIGATMLRFFPVFLRPFAALFVTNVSQTLEKTIKHLEGPIKDRLRMEKEYGKEWPGKPNDLLSWLMDEAKGEEREIHALVLRVLTLNFASIHTSSMSLTHAVYHVAAHPEFADVMRKEVQQAISKYGWTKEATDNMPHIDSFLRESHRFNGLGSTTMARKAMKDFTFSDGTFIPKGGFVSVVERPLHHDAENYEEPEVFNPWRFVEHKNAAKAESGEGVAGRFGVVSTSAEYVTFGHGKHAWYAILHDSYDMVGERKADNGGYDSPGRFFAANELKAMLAHLVLTYDIKMENEGVIPPPFNFGMKMIPNPKGEIMYRRRKSQSTTSV
ncbi:hypothetical protein EUX98_g6286 [Antrodiella citrinella]|uniref:Cytochrome P450 n=1 Tax=Antrodiella citrinella TaxID=2447956 RepID=A0A4S4MS13_9APHY|nr:hypothetical protein EUX98_g6286 [Antrodiella citrinella]